MNGPRHRLVACGILSKEICHLIEKHGWPIDPLFLDSSLHVDLGRLESELRSALSCCVGEDISVFFGACHPHIDRILGARRSARTPVENCMEALLGHEAYMRELKSGAFFLFEDWAKRARAVILSAFGGSLVVAREVYESEHRYLLCVRTPCSGSFEAEAEQTGRMLGLPLRWMDASLDHLESILAATILQRRETPPCLS